MLQRSVITFRYQALMERRMTMLFMMILLMLNVPGCSNRQLYDGVMQNRRHACLKLLPQQQAECMQRYQKSYEQYEQERQAQFTEDDPL